MRTALIGIVILLGIVLLLALAGYGPGRYTAIPSPVTAGDIWGRFYLLDTWSGRYWRCDYTACGEVS